MSLVSINDVLKITTRVEKIHPYKVVGNRDSYSPYNEGWSDCVSLIEHYLEQIPSAEPERKKGEWTKSILAPNGYKQIFYEHDCSNFVYESPYNFCPYCGADMRGDR